jgi:Anti-sigma-K factor rskA
MRTDGLGFSEHAETVERLEEGVARVTPPDDLFERILDETKPATVTPMRRRVVTWAAPALAAAAAVLVTVAITSDGDGLGDPARTASLTGRNVSGNVALYRPEERDGMLVVDVEEVPDPPSGSYYEIWLSLPGGRKVPIGTFTPEEGKAHLELRLPKAGRYLSIDISIEEESGPPDHSGRTVATAQLL